MKNTMLISLLFMLTGCTYTITQVHTEGAASDVVDDTVTPTTHITIPINP